MRLLVLGLLVIVMACGESPPPLRVSVSPRVAMAPSNLRVDIRLVPDESDRWLRVVADSGDASAMARSSSWTLEGEQSARTWRVEWRDLTAGRYDILASVGNSQRIRATARDYALIVAR